ncbi:MAG: ABC transporter ATP-binding protein [Nocardioides sp.]|uniref:ABC transporter ATP-binding protein n=1 Tax=Nocardioides sp. TaxID=35761 RepID=UPI0039E41485
MSAITVATDSAAEPLTGPALAVRDLRVDLAGTDIYIVRDVSFEVARGEIIGVIGESGCGKTTVLTSLLGSVRAGAEITSGSVEVGGVDLLALSERELRHYRGGEIAYVPQDPSAALNPALRLETQLRETLAAHGVSDKAAQLDRIRAVLEEVKLPSDRAFLRRHPHQLSGGQQQRVAIAMAFVCEPLVAVLDEPTTGLDVTTQARVLEAVREMCRHHGTAGVFVSHDLAAVSELADRIVVMYSGHIVESGSTAEVTLKAGHPYTRALSRAIPDPRARHELRVIPSRVAALNARPAGCVFSNRCELVTDACHAGEIPMTRLDEGHAVACLEVGMVEATARVEVVEPEHRPAPAGSTGSAGSGFVEVRGLTASYSGNTILRGLDLSVPQGIVMGIVGESGSGKSTLARCLGGLHAEATGEVSVGGEQLPFGSRRRSREERLKVQYIFQSASSALNPRRTVGESIAEPMRAFGLVTSAAARRDRVAELLADVSLDPDMANSYPAQLSGGERQRVTVARALATTPSVLICDEITSSLDVSVQASVLRLIQRLRRENDLTLLFVTHNLGVIRAIADEVAVLRNGVIVERGEVDQVLDSPQDPYTRELLRDTPSFPTLESLEDSPRPQPAPPVASPTLPAEERSND